MGISREAKKGRRAIESAASELTKTSTFITNDVWPEIKSAVSEVKKTTNFITEEAWPELKSDATKTMTFMIEEMWPDVKILLSLVALSFALPFVLYAAYQARRLLATRCEPTAQSGQQARRMCCSRIIEGMVLYFIYWFCLALALVLAINITSLLVHHGGHIFQFMWG